MTVPASPQSIVAACNGPGVMVTVVASSGFASTRIPRAASASSMRSVSRLRSVPERVDGPSAWAARTSARLVIDLLPGSVTVARNGPGASGAFHTVTQTVFHGRLRSPSRRGVRRGRPARLTWADSDPTGGSGYGFFGYTEGRTMQIWNVFDCSVRIMKLVLSRGIAAIAVSAAALLTLAACSDDSSDSADSTTSAAESTEAALDSDLRAEDLVLVETDFTVPGDFVVYDKAAIDAKKSDDPEVTPANCAAIAENDDDAEGFDKARAELTLADGSTIESEVTLGESGSFDSVTADIEACPAMTMTSVSGSGEFVAELENSIVEVEGATVPAMMVVSVGEVNADGVATPLAIRSAGAYVDGVTVGVTVTLTGENATTWTEDDDAIVLDLLNKQIARVQESTV